ncbi:ATP-binding protein [Pseudomonas sp. 14P_8.1_Bac3]|uniref:ATP-binding protein n=1 Tax=Pseudomonas sp. 14P_8.1_Bac3 TaxID=2971621 RepID=UPI0021CA1ABC|nr:ATP-binding protein [Pseudomonas sp. 14P_8.1_Bac3]MCU1758740.1 ATP-binding protein [Pseudomonas sp. 14P_8.1_Bac3]
MRSENVVAMSSVAVVEPHAQPAMCEDHGPFSQKINVIFGKEFKTGCPECSRMRNEEEAARKQAQEALESRLRMAEKLGAALIPKRFTGKTFDAYKAATPEQKEALRICRKYADVFPEIFETGRCLLLLGKPGTGKTHLAVSIANQIMSVSNATAVYRTVGGLLQAIRGTYDNTSEQSESQIFASMIRPSLLILDEIGATKEKPSDFELATLFTIINGRYEQQRPTIIVSNLKAEELPGALGERCVDRLREGGGIAVKFDWESQRGKEGF